jgi:drug/metabolite transporter (DMT)-like permease
MAKASSKRAWPMLRWWMLLAVALFLGANAHLLYVAIDSDPGCVAHLKDAGSAPGQFRAATSSC